LNGIVFGKVGGDVNVWRMRIEHFHNKQHRGDEWMREMSEDGQRREGVLTSADRAQRVSRLRTVR